MPLKDICRHNFPVGNCDVLPQQTPVRFYTHASETKRPTDASWLHTKGFAALLWLNTLQAELFPPISAVY